MKGTRIALSTGLAVKTADYPMMGRKRIEPVYCYNGGCWQKLDPRHCDIIVLGVDEEVAQRNRQRNRQRTMDALPIWADEIPRRGGGRGKKQTDRS